MAGGRECHSSGTHMLSGEHACPAGPGPGFLSPSILGQNDLVLQGEAHYMCQIHPDPDSALLFPSTRAPAWRLQVDVHGKRAGRAPGVNISSSWLCFQAEAMFEQMLLY